MTPFYVRWQTIRGSGTELGMDQFILYKCLYSIFIVTNRTYQYSIVHGMRDDVLKCECHRLKLENLNGKNKLAKFAGMVFPNVFQMTSREILPGKSFEYKGKWSKSVFKNNNPIVLELGCGKGEYSVGLAELFPEKNFIGVDIKGARMWTGAKDSLKKNLKNVAFLRTNIEMINHFFDANEVSEIWLTFPIIDEKTLKDGFHELMKRYQQIVKIAD